MGASNQATQHFKSLCQSKANFVLPETPVSQLGFVWEGSKLAQHDYFTRLDGLETLNDPGSGGYQVVELRQLDGQIKSFRWNPDKSWPHYANRTVSDSVEHSVPLLVRMQDLTTDKEREHGIVGHATTIVDSRNGTVVASRVIFARVRTGNGASDTVIDICPKEARATLGCRDGSCSALQFIRAAVRPIPPVEQSRAFHLFRNDSPAKSFCKGFFINVGPDIKPNDLEWWASGEDGWEALNIRVRGTTSQIVCDRFFWTGNSVFPTIRFFDSDLSVSTAKIHKASKRGTAASPAQLK
jgi:hypothetical protein